MLSPREISRLTAAVVEVVAANVGGGGGGVSSALSKLLLPALGVLPDAEKASPSSSSSEEEEEPTSPSPLPSSVSSSTATPQAGEPAVLDVSSLRLSPTEARAAVLCALADLAAAGRAPGGGLKVIVSRQGEGGRSPQKRNEPPSSSLLRLTIVRLLRDELRLLEKEEEEEGAGGGEGRREASPLSSSPSPSSPSPSTAADQDENLDFDDSSPVLVSEKSLTTWLERRGGAKKGE